MQNENSSPPAPPQRFPLPDRRFSYTKRAQLGNDDRAFFITIGFYDDGRPGDVFADGWREGAQLGFIIKDACTAISIALQHGIPAATLAKSLSRQPVWTPEGMDEGWGSQIGVIVAEIMAAEDYFAKVRAIGFDPQAQ
jgi:hypothetical protein